MTNPACAAIVNAIGQIREVVHGDVTAPKRYLVIAAWNAGATRPSPFRHRRSPASINPVAISAHALSARGDALLDDDQRRGNRIHDISRVKRTPPS